MTSTPIRAKDIIADVRKVVARRPLTDFLDAALSLQTSSKAPTQPYLVHQSMHSKKSTARQTKVVFEDEVDQLSAVETLQQQKATMKKRAVQLQESLGIAIHTAQDVHEYFAAKSLVEWLPQLCYIPTVDTNYYLSTAFKQTKALEISTLVQEQQNAQSETAGFVAKVTRTKTCARRPDCLHHWGTRHAFQLFLRSALERRDASHRMDGPKGGRMVVEQSPCGQPMLPGVSAACSRDALLDAVAARTQMQHRVVPLLHLQCRAMLKDKRLLRDPQLNVGLGDDAFYRGGSLSRTMSLNSDSESGPNTARPTTSSSHSDTKSAVSAMTSGGGKKSSKLQHVVFNDKLEYWIALKGLVFRIVLDRCPSGRAAYYRAVLLPVFSGRECTFPFLALTVNFNPWDFISAKERAALMTKAQASVAASHPIMALGVSATNTALDVLLTKEQKAHIDRIFAMFRVDFDLIGELEGFEHYWF